MQVLGYQVNKTFTNPVDLQIRGNRVTYFGQVQSGWEFRCISFQRFPFDMLDRWKRLGGDLKENCVSKVVFRVKKVLVTILLFREVWCVSSQAE